MRRVLLVAIALSIAGCGLDPGGSWQDANGDVISTDQLWSFRGEQRHCGWGSAIFLWIGHGLPGVTEDHYDQYVRDPRGLFTDLLANSYSGSVDIPQDAEFTGYANRTLRLWIAPSVTSVVFLETGERIERWPRVEGPDPILCA